MSSSAQGKSSLTDADWVSKSVNTWDRFRQAQLDRDAIAQLNAMAPYADEVAAATQSDYDHELEAYLVEYADAVALAVAKKQADYGPHAINNAPGGALNGINVRLHDKISRAANLAGKTHPVFNESLFDTYHDIAGYALIAMLYLDGKW